MFSLSLITGNKNNNQKKKKKSTWFGFCKWFNSSKLVKLSIECQIGFGYSKDKIRLTTFNLKN